MPSMAAPAARTAEQPVPTDLEFFPVEILVNIYTVLDLKHALRLASTNRMLRRIYQTHWIHILRPILLREFSPLDGLLRLVPMSESDIPFSQWHNRRTNFGGLLISNDISFDRQPPIHFRHEHMPRVMEVVKAVSRWESAFPRLRFAELAEERRRLRTHEKQRLRCALYNLWRYSNSYHQHHDGYDVRLPWNTSPQQGEVRAESLRLLSTMELYELQDLWKTIRAAVSTQLCPSVSVLLMDEDSGLSEVYLQHLGWGDGLENDIIVRNVLRLRPDYLLDLLDFVADHPTTSKDKVRSMIRDRHPTVHHACESLSHTLARVVGERLNIFPGTLNESMAKFVAERNFPIPFGGILDDEYAMEELRSHLSSDGREGWPDSESEEGSFFSDFAD